MEKIEEGSITVEFVGIAKVNDKRLARLKIAVRFAGERRRSEPPEARRHRVFDLESSILTYLSVKARTNLLDGRANRRRD